MLYASFLCSPLSPPCASYTTACITAWFPSPHLHICAPSPLVVSFGTVFMPCVLVKLSCAVSAFLMLRLICPLLRWKLEARTMSLFILMPRQSARYILNFKWLPLFGNHPGTPLERSKPDRARGMGHQPRLHINRRADHDCLALMSHGALHTAHRSVTAPGHGG